MKLYTIFTNDGRILSYGEIEDNKLMMEDFQQLVGSDLDCLYFDMCCQNMTQILKTFIILCCSCEGG